MEPLLISVNLLDDSDEQMKPRL